MALLFFALQKENHMKWFGYYLLGINLLAFLLMGIDKRRARRRLWRIPEKTLFLPVWLGGGIGGTIGMFFFRHKTKHGYFRLGFPVIAVLEYAALFYFCFWLFR